MHVQVHTTNGNILDQTIVLGDNILEGEWDVVVKRMYCSTDMSAPLRFTGKRQGCRR
jgi:hypothetical protein